MLESNVNRLKTPLNLGLFIVTLLQSATKHVTVLKTIANDFAIDSTNHNEDMVPWERFELSSAGPEPAIPDSCSKSG